MKTFSGKLNKRGRRQARIRAKISGTSVRPRLSIFKSNTAIYAQLIDDDAGKTLASGSTKVVTGKNGLEKAHALGMHVAKKAVEAKIKKAVFDRGGYRYTGKIARVAEGAREGGLEF